MEEGRERGDVHIGEKGMVGLEARVVRGGGGWAMRKEWGLGEEEGGEMGRRDGRRAR